MQYHAALDASLQSGGFIEIEVHPCRVANQGQQPLHVGAFADGLGFFFLGGNVGDVGMLANTGKFPGDILGVEHQVNAPSRDRAVGHAGVFGRRFTLGKRDSSRCLDDIASFCAIRGGAREDYTDGLAVAILGQGLKKLVDRHVYPAGEGPGP